MGKDHLNTSHDEHAVGRPEIGRPALTINPEPEKKSDEKKPEPADERKED